jgi:hypothetical protein
MVDSREETAIKEDKIAIIDIITIRITTINITISSKIKSTGFIIRLVID